MTFSAPARVAQPEDRAVQFHQTKGNNAGTVCWVIPDPILTKCLEHGLCISYEVVQDSPDITLSNGQTYASWRGRVHARACMGELVRD